jgi:hypothetical protein
MNEEPREHATDLPPRKPIEDELVLARETCRGISPPEFDGAEIELTGQRVNLWWHDGRRGSRAFSDAFITRQNELALVVADVSDPLDATGLALSLRAFLRAKLTSSGDLAHVMEDVEHWGRHEPHWQGFCQLGIALLSQNRQLHYLTRGALRLCRTDRTGRTTPIEIPATLPILFASQRATDSR